MANTTADVQFARIARVDEVMRTRGWSLRICEDLAAELGVERVAVYRYRKRAMEWTQRAMKPIDIERWRAQQVQALWDTAMEARKDKDYTAAARCLDVQARIIGTISPLKMDGRVQVEHTVVVIPEVLDAVTGQKRALTLPEIQAELARSLAIEAHGEVVEVGAEREAVPTQVDGPHR